jgi:hypothetical protein
MILPDTSALFVALAMDGSGRAWSALPDAPIVDDTRATKSRLTAARRAVRHVLPRRKPAGAGAPHPFCTDATTATAARGLS